MLPSRNAASVVLSLIATAGLFAGQAPTPAKSPRTISIDQKMTPPDWAIAERAMLAAAAEGAQWWVDRYVRPDGSLNIDPLWGVTDGPDDIMESIRGWPFVYAMGAPESVIRNFERVWEGHLRQFGQAKLPAIELARDGIFVKEFPSSFDWEHNGEGLQAFYWYGLGKPDDAISRTRARRFAGFYLNEDPAAPNYDPQRKIIKSLFNGSIGPVTRPVTPVDWDGDQNPQRATRFTTSTNIRGDHPLNLLTVTLATHAYLLTHDAKYKRWAIEYVDAWRDRALANGGNIPSNVGLDGKIGGEWSGKWYGGIFGWNSPDDGLRNYVLRGVPAAFGQAAMLARDMRYVDIIRRQVDNIFGAARVENGQTLLPHYYGEKDGKVGWYGYHPGEFYPTGALGNLPETTIELYLWSFAPADLQRILPNPPDRRNVQGWIEFLQGTRPGYPLEALQQETQQSARITAGRGRGQPGGYGPSPVAFESLANLTLGSANLYGSGDVVRSQVRYFDPETRRAGLPEDVAALVEKITPEGIALTLVNTSTASARRVTVQAGAYGEHQILSIIAGGKTTPINAASVEVRLAPGGGERLTMAMKRYANDPTLAFPWR
ncbi:MAG: hypothetical protein ND807_06405 [Vicinamibacterales bacterium]|nr:hypothetical protein [Vicinamibacterales bacterium]